jgi:hypothetical protein
MNRSLGYGLAVVATMLTLYYGIPLFLAVIRRPRDNCDDGAHPA